MSKNLALSASFVAQIRPYTSLPIDVHLMVEAPASFIPALLDAGADAFSLHPETICREAFRVINMLRQAGKEVGMVLNPATPVESIQHYLHLLDKVTVMTVDPAMPVSRLFLKCSPKLRSFISSKRPAASASCWKSMAPVTATPTARCWAPAHRY